MLELILYIYLFILGLLFGSFFNVVGLRTADNESIIVPRSHCPYCKHQLTVLELIPVVSYIMQKGRCKSCEVPISIKYPLFELATASLFTISPMLVGWSKDLLLALVLVSLVVIITISDLYKMIIPNKVLLFFGGTIIILRLFIPTTPWWDAYVGAAVGFLILFLIALLSKGGMGGGDVKLFFVLGFFVGLKGILLTLFLASLLGMIYGLIIMAMKKVGRKHAIPFGPFIGMAVLIVFYFNHELNALLLLLNIDF